GTASLTYQWQKKAPAAAAFSNISGATSASYTFTTLASDNGAQFKCTVTNSAGSVTSNAATLTVNVTLTINAQNGTVNRSTQGTQVTGGYIYPAGIVLTFTATPNTGYSFTSWSGDLTGSVNPASITLNANKTVTANFISQAPEIPITVGQSVTGAIHAVGEKNHYAFNANANDTVTIRAVTTYNSLQCYLELYGPDGGKLDENRSQIDKTLPASGKYTILLRDFNNLFTGNYCLIYGIINNNSWAPTIVAGQTINGTISANDRIKFYQFSANINDTVTFHTVAIYDILLCYLELYGPGGEKLDENRNQIDKTLPASGRYTILLRDFNSLHTGDYKLTYTRNNSAPIADSLIPSSGSSQADSQVFFTANYSDSDGFSDMGEIYLLVNGATDGANCFYAYYNPYLDQLYLRNDVNTTWLGGFSPSTPTTIENSYAALNCGKTEINKSGNSVTVKWSVSFKGAFSGHDYNIYLLVKDRVGATSGWLKMGVWRVDPRTGPINIVSFTPFDKSRFLEGTTIGCSARAEPSGDTYEYQFLIDGTVKKQFSPDNKWDWQVVPQDKGIHALTIKVRNQYGTTTEDSHRLIVYRRPVDPQ
ncbi:MAG: hypothetical protein NT033_04860, partial [Candidatus Omnitrophica bacterium]|nr:hypothetical protein [Candidatus Omnitrophota bacterium]